MTTCFEMTNALVTDDVIYAQTPCTHLYHPGFPLGHYLGGLNLLLPEPTSSQQLISTLWGPARSGGHGAAVAAPAAGPQAALRSPLAEPNFVDERARDSRRSLSAPAIQATCNNLQTIFSNLCELGAPRITKSHCVYCRSKTGNKLRACTVGLDERLRAQFGPPLSPSPHPPNRTHTLLEEGLAKQEQRDGRSQRPRAARGAKAPREDRASEAPAMDVGDGGRVEFGPVPGWRPGGTNRMYRSFCALFLSLCLADMGGRSMGCHTVFLTLEQL